MIQRLLTRIKCITQGGAFSKERDGENKGKHTTRIHTSLYTTCIHQVVVGA